MSTGTIIVVIVAALLVLGLIAWLGSTQVRRKQLRQRFGPEYDRTVQESPDRRTAERELIERAKRHSELDVKPLAPDARERYARQWTQLQAQFVDNPATAVGEADRLVTVVMAERGYPTEDYRQQVADLSVRHASTVGHYRAAHDLLIRNDEQEASTEELREAMVHYRALFVDLVEVDMDSGNGNGNGARQKRS